MGRVPGVAEFYKGRMGGKAIRYEGPVFRNVLSFRPAKTSNSHSIRRARRMLPSGPLWRK